MTYTTSVDGVVETCGACKFWLRVEPHGPNKEEWHERGECRRYPPSLIGRQETDKQLKWSEFQGAWPTTLDVDFCGEFEDREDDE